MRRAYIVTGELEDGTTDVYYAVCHSMSRADELCYEAEAEDNGTHIFTWHEVIEEDDEL